MSDEITPDTPVDEILGDTVDPHSNDDVSVPDLPGPDVDDPAEYEAQIAALTGELAEERAARLAAEERAKALDPVADVADRLFEDPADVIGFFDRQALLDAAATELKKVNQGRIRSGLLPVEWDEADKDAAIQTEAAKIVAERRGLVPTAGPLTRVLKMLTPSGNLIQIPIEDQVNNHKGSLADSVERYRRKGFKLTRPFLCGARDCWEAVESDGDGNPQLGGYCSEDHRRRAELGKESAETGDRRRILSV